METDQCSAWRLRRRRDSRAQPEVSQPRSHEAISASGKVVQKEDEVGDGEDSGGCKVLKAWSVNLVIGLAGGGNATPRLQTSSGCEGARVVVVDSYTEVRSDGVS